MSQLEPIVPPVEQFVSVALSIAYALVKEMKYSGLTEEQEFAFARRKAALVRELYLMIQKGQAPKGPDSAN